MNRTGENRIRNSIGRSRNQNLGAINRIATRELLNVGCGRTWHPEWTNIDLISTDRAVLVADICEGLPFADQMFDAVYHSHLLEHLDVEHGQRLVAECFRVLRPGGILRIVVPDMEQIARLYLKLHERAWQGNVEAQEQYEWIKLELLDQLVRSESGGRMGQYMSQLEDAEAGFVRSRIGVEYAMCREQGGDSLDPGVSNGHPASSKSKPENPWVDDSWRVRLARWLVKKIAGAHIASRFDEAEFRARGEVHRWMYDRHSLRMLCQGQGFADFEVCSALSSRVPEFDRYELDCIDGQVRKPDSLFVECMRPDSV